jgi:hypothetical protein
MACLRQLKALIFHKLQIWSYSKAIKLCRTLALLLPSDFWWEKSSDMHCGGKIHNEFP